jgi:hypothetical protein
MHLLLESSSGPFALADCHVLGDSGSPTSLRRLVSVDSARLRDEGVVALTVSPNSMHIDVIRLKTYDGIGKIGCFVCCNNKITA